MEFFLNNAFKAPDDQSAQYTNTGWINNLIRRFWSVSKPKASIPLVYCEMFPGKISTKKIAKAIPAFILCLTNNRIANPSIISMTPDDKTTKFIKAGSFGSHLGT